MIIVDVIGRTIQSFPIKKYLVSQENEVVQVAFHLEKKVDDIQLESLNFRLDFQNETGNKHTRFLTKKVLEDKVELLWNVSSEDTYNAGKTSIAIVGSNTDGVLWRTFDAQIEISAGLDLNDFVFENKDLLSETINRVEDAFLKIESITQGKSAYQIWLDKGNVGTIDDYLQSLKGAKGDKGDSASYNPNLLINGDFRIWQRGTTFETSGNKYTADRWITPVWSHISKTSNGLLIKGNRIDGIGGISQIVTREEIGDISGKLTFFCEIKAFFIVNLSIDVDGIILKKVLPVNRDFVKTSFTFDVPPNFKKIKLQLTSGSGGVPSLNLAEIKWCKLEVGEIATPFVPKSYGEELALCQRYYLKKDATLFTTNDTMVAVSGETLVGTVTFPNVMRMRPTIIFNEGACFRSNNTGHTLYKPVSFNTQHGPYGLSAIHSVSFSSDRFLINNNYSILFEADAEIY